VSAVLMAKRTLVQFDIVNSYSWFFLWRCSCDDVVKVLVL